MFQPFFYSSELILVIVAIRPCMNPLLKPKTPSVSKTFQTILADFNTAVVWIVLILPQICSYSVSFLSLWKRSKDTATISITVISMFHSFVFSSLARSKYSSIFSILLFLFHGPLERQNLPDGKIFFNCY